MRIGVISDTHGLLRPEAVAALRGSDLIVHAGDVGDPSVLEQLEVLAPVCAVRGNVDRAPWAHRLSFTEVVEAGGAELYVLHILEDLDLDPAASGFAAVVYGHTHRASVERRDGVMYLNPGAAGPDHGAPPPTLARLHVVDGVPEAEIIQLLGEERS